MDAMLLSVDGERKGDVALKEEVFGCDVSEGTIYYAVKNELANRRVGCASTKTRAEVRGGGRKPWRQKGTGNARVGTRRSPLWTGGGVIFGPKPRDYSYSMPKKMKRLAMRSILSLKLREGKLKVVEDFTVDSGRTRDLVKILAGLVPAERTVLVLKDDDQLIKRAGRNIPWLTFLSYNRLRAHDLFYGRQILVMEGAAAKLNEFYGAEG